MKLISRFILWLLFIFICFMNFGFADTWKIIKLKNPNVSEITNNPTSILTWDNENGQLITWVNYFPWQILFNKNSILTWDDQDSKSLDSGSGQELQDLESPEQKRSRIEFDNKVKSLIKLSWDAVYFWDSLLTWEDLLLFTTSWYLTGKYENSATANAIADFRSRQQVLIDDIYSNTTFSILLDIDDAKDNLKQLTNEFSGLISDFNEVSEKKGKVDSKYNEIKDSILSIIEDVKNSKDNVNARIIKINLYTIKLLELKKNVQEIKTDIDTTKENLIRYTNFLYKVNNDYYWSNLNIDDIKLLVKSENITNTLSDEDIIKSLTVNLNELLYRLSYMQDRYMQFSRRLNDLRVKYKYEVEEYERDIEAFTEQKKYLLQMMRYFKDDKIELDEKYNQLIDNKINIKRQIVQMMKLTKQKLTETNVGSWIDITSLLQVSEREDSDKFFSWPVLPVTKISAFFNDQNYIDNLWIDHYAIDIPIPQKTSIYAPANWIVYKVFNNDWPWINRMIMLHKHWYVTMYLHMYDIFVKEWDFIKRWEIIWLSWWRPWTRWAWLLTSWPHLHFAVIKNWEQIDPLSVLDLSIIKSKSILQPKYHLKYMKDRLTRFTDLSDIDYVDWASLSERRARFLEQNASWPFADVGLWEDALWDLNIDIDFGICIAFAETSLWKNYAQNSMWNVWNVWNNDRWERRWFATPVQWAMAIYWAVTNKYLSNNNTVDQMSRYGNKHGSIYASSDTNWQKNVITCLSKIKWYRVPEDYPFKKYVQWYYINQERIENTWLNANSWSWTIDQSNKSVHQELFGN